MRVVRGTVLDRSVDAARSTALAAPLRGVRRVADSVLRAVNHPPLSVELDGLRISGYLRHRSFLRHLASGDYEPLARRSFLECLQPGVCVVDGGAHIGAYTLLAAERIGSGPVFAFEPDPYNFEALRANVRRASVRKAIPVNAALADDPDASASFHVSSGTIAGSLRRKSYVGDIERTIPVETTTIDRQLEDVGLRGLVLKLDVEGAEPAALRGATRSLERCNWCRVIVEQNLAALRDAGEDEFATVRFLGERGFAISVIDERGGELYPVSDDRLPEKCNLIADKGRI